MEKKILKIKRGKKARQAGKRFELQVRSDLERKGWLVVKWTNQVDLDKNKIIPAKSKFNPFLGRVMSEGSGLPDFLAYKLPDKDENYYEIVGVEAKLGKYLDATEKKKLLWLLEHKIFNYILIAFKRHRGVIEYERFQ